MVAEQVFENLGISINGKLIYCANSISLDISVAELEASCLRNGAYQNFVPGAIGITASADGVMTVATNDASGDGSTDADDNVTSENMLDITLAKTIFDFTFGSLKPGEPKYAAKGFFTSFNPSASVGAVGTYSAGMRINGPLVKSINPTV